MTNVEKFEEVFGIKPDIESMIIKCPIHEILKRGCKYYDDSGCHCETWWNEKFKEPNYVEKIQKG